MRTLAAALLLTTLAAAQTHKPAPATPDANEKLVFTLILSRHGIRPPLTSNEVLNTRAADPWPTWPVPLGHLTPHGVQAISLMGAYLRHDFARTGLLPADACPAPTDIYLYSDTDERNISSTRATIAAMLPGCPLPSINIFVPPADISDNNKRDPLFLPTQGGVTSPSKEARAAALRTLLHNDPESVLSVAANPELNELAHILAPDADHPAAKPLLTEPVTLKEASVSGPLNSASSLIEDVLLEYIDARPLTEVAWGRLGTTDAQAEVALRRLEPLHAKAFALSTRSPLSATVSSSNMLSHILDTLHEVAERPIGDPVPPDVPGVLGFPADTKLVYLSAHDSNLYGIAGLLNLHWTVDTITDDTPPDSQLVFELWQPTTSRQNATEPTIRLRYRAQTWNQLRNLTALTTTNPPAEVALTPPGCVPAKPCPLSKFLTAARAAVDPAYVAPLMPTQPAQ